MLFITATVAVWFRLTFAAFELALGDDSDLTSFVTRPEIKVPILNVTAHSPNKIAPGFFFAAPFARIYQEEFPSSYYQPCQTGPSIYSSDGELVWTGACAFSNGISADFRPAVLHGSWRLTGISVGLHEDDLDIFGAGERSGFGYILNNAYDRESKVYMPRTIETFNIHEFKVLNDTNTVLIILYRPEYIDISMIDDVGREAGWVANMGFQEVDIVSGKVNFEWWALDHVQVGEGDSDWEDLDEGFPSAWNFFHLNSVDKDVNGDYLISASNTNTLFAISGTNGSIKWRLGGRNSTFELLNFDFKRQHDARFLSARDDIQVLDDEHQYVSLFNNAADGLEGEMVRPSVLVIALNYERNTASLVREIRRPDNGFTVFGGNAQYLPNGNMFASWADNGYATEHDHTGALMMEARFTSNRFKSYRMYKSDFVGSPSEEIALKCTAYGVPIAKPTTVCWVSWNGATEVAQWQFWSPENDIEVSDDEPSSIGLVDRKGFETRILIDGLHRTAYVWALDSQGQMLASSRRINVTIQD